MNSTKEMSVETLGEREKINMYYDFGVLYRRAIEGAVAHALVFLFFENSLLLFLLYENFSTTLFLIFDH